MKKGIGSGRFNMVTNIALPGKILTQLVSIIITSCTFKARFGLD